MTFDLQLVHRKKPREITYLRLAPYTRENPTLSQMLHRIRVGEVAKSATGLRGLDPDTRLPRAASQVQKTLTGILTGRTKRKARWQQLLSIKVVEETDAEVIAHRLIELLDLDVAF